MNGEASFREFTRTLEREKPIILTELSDGQRADVLLLRGLTECSLDKDTRDPAVLAEVQDKAARYVSTIRDVVPALYHLGLMSQEYQFVTVNVEGRHMVGLAIPDGNRAIDTVRQLYSEATSQSPFTIITNLQEEGLMNQVLEIQNIGQTHGKS